MTSHFTLREKISFAAGSGLFLCLLVLGLWFNIPYIIVAPAGMLMVLFLLQDIHWLFNALLLSIPLSLNVVEYTSVNLDFPDEALMLLSSLCYIFFILQNYHQIEFKRLIKHPLVILILLSYTWTLIAVVYSENVALSVKYILKKIWFILPFLFLAISIFQDRSAIVKGYRFFAVPLIIVVSIVLFRFSAVGFRFEEVHDPMQPFFYNHVIFGSMLSCMAPLAAGALFLSRKGSIQWTLSLFALLLVLFAVYFSYSRAAWMGVLFALGASVLIRLRIMHWGMLVFYGLVLSLVLWLSHQNKFLDFKPKFEKTIMHESLEDHIMATIQGTDISSAERYYRWIAAIKMSADRPLTGVGPNNFYDYYKAYSVTSFKTWVSRNNEKSTTHNYFLFMLVEQGYPAMLLYAFLIVFIFYYGQKVITRSKDKFDCVVVLSCLSMIAAFFINNFFSELIENDKIGSMFYLGIAVIVAIDLKNRNKIPTIGYSDIRP